MDAPNDAQAPRRVRRHLNRPLALRQAISTSAQVAAGLAIEFVLMRWLGHTEAFGWIAVIGGTLGCAATVLHELQFRDRSDGRLLLSLDMAIAVLGPFFAAGAIAAFALMAWHLLSGIPAAAVAGIGWLHSVTTKAWMVVATVSLTAVTGAAFFIFRLRQRFIYGLTEATAGIVIAAHRMNQEPGVGLPSESGFYIALLTAGIYLVVRGLDNMHQAIRAGDPFVDRVRKISARRAGRMSRTLKVRKFVRGESNANPAQDEASGAR
jgi:hypothetical protein